jgi:hypothetical protein
MTNMSAPKNRPFPLLLKAIIVAIVFPAFFFGLRDHYSAVRKAAALMETLKAARITSIEVREFPLNNTGSFELTGVGKHLATVTNAQDISKFQQLLSGGAPNEWNHYSILRNFKLRIDTTAAHFDLVSIQPRGHSNEIWIWVSGIDGALVPNLDQWIDSFQRANK